MSRKIVVTGAGTGLGRAIARRMAKNGDTLILLGRTLSKLESVAEEIGNGAMAVRCDITDPDSVRDAFTKIGKVHKTIDVLVNNAGVFKPFTIAEARDDQVMAALMTNLAGPIFCSRSAIPMMEKGGHIINVSSESVGENFYMLSLYQSAKAGLERFSDAMREELREPGIRVTTVRAGQMMDEDASFDISPELAMRFAEGNMKRGIDLRSRPITHFNSVAQLFDQIINLPEDLHVPVVLLEARHR